MASRFCFGARYGMQGNLEQQLVITCIRPADNNAKTPNGNFTCAILCMAAAEIIMRLTDQLVRRVR